MLDHLRQDFDLGIVERHVGIAVDQFRDQDFRPVVLDVGLIQQVGMLDEALARGIEDFLLNRCVHAQFGADLADQSLLDVHAAGAFELFEKPFDLAVIGLEERYGIESLASGHGALTWCWGVL